MRKNLVYCLLFFMVTLGEAQPPQVFFEQGNAAYNGGNYRLAIEKYSAILDQQMESPSLYFNLGNAHYRLGNVAESVFYFEKAYHLMPSDESIKNNRSFAKNMTLDAIEELPQTQLEQWQTHLLNQFSLNGWTYLVLVFIWLTFLLLATYLWVKTIFMKRLFFVFGLSSLLLVGLTWSFAHQKKRAQSQVAAVIFSDEISVWSEPNKRGEAVFNLHEGTVVLLLDALEGWSKIKIANGAEGWIENQDIQRLDQLLRE